MIDEREKDDLMPYRVGALIYTPALHVGVAEKLCAGEFAEINTLALCLEDAVTETGVREAEAQLVRTLAHVAERATGALPLLFVRVRDCAQLAGLPGLLGDLLDLLTGVIFPKFDLTNAAEYCALIGGINATRPMPLYFMPILESKSVMRLDSRDRVLLGLRELLNGCKSYVLNIRVGAMDFCNLYGVRRSVSQSIYDIGVVRDVLADILTVFADDYVVSAPVWEYFGTNRADADWAVGLENEVRLDIANGFIGKTIVHPSQLPIVRRLMSPTRTDYEDAKAILGWRGGSWGVAKSVAGNRMNELATHRKWARKILVLSETYGVRDA
jgi:citrate lyase beta subunit